MNEPYIHVGIMSDGKIDFALLSTYRCHNIEVTGKQEVTYENGKIKWNNGFYNELLFEAQSHATAAFELYNVTIGVNFHWERKESQRFMGNIKIIVDGNKLTVINVIYLEDYLTSVISSEMSATASIELLKAHAVISRSWLLAQIERDKSKAELRSDIISTLHSDNELISWFDREDHTLFDVCADDHCQRYQGITRATTQAVREAIAATRGELLMYESSICDARYSKCCGGALEEFEFCWENIHLPYLIKKRDWITDCELPNLQDEAQAEAWIRSTPKAFCNTKDKKILNEVLNNYDQETTDFYRWRVEYDQEELGKLIFKRSGIDFGEIKDLVPIARGTSGRLWKLKIVGTKLALIIGKELEIRRTLSSSHLYSSAFVIDKENVSSEGIPQRFIFTGAGWGHGVGLCQIGAAMMSEQGYNYREILSHYYANAEIEKRYQ